MQNTLKSNFQQKEDKSEPQALRRFRNGIEEEKTYLDYKKNLDKFCKTREGFLLIRFHNFDFT